MATYEPEVLGTSKHTVTTPDNCSCQCDEENDGDCCSHHPQNPPQMKARTLLGGMVFCLPLGLASLFLSWCASRAMRQGRTDASRLYTRHARRCTRWSVLAGLASVVATALMILVLANDPSARHGGCMVANRVVSNGAPVLDYLDYCTHDHRTLTCVDGRLHMRYLHACNKSNHVQAARRGVDSAGPRVVGGPDGGCVVDGRLYLVNGQALGTQGGCKGRWVMPVCRKGVLVAVEGEPCAQE